MLDKDIFQTLARCSDALRTEAELRFVDDRHRDLTKLADEAQQHCKDAGLLSEPEHSKTPWREVEYTVYDKQGHVVAAMPTPTSNGTPSWEEIKANAARIVACVNACAGVASDDLGDVFRIMRTLLVQLKAANIVHSEHVAKAMLVADRILDKCSK